MSEERIDVVVTDRINPKVADKLRKIGTTSDRADKGLGRLSKRLLSIAALIQSTRVFIKLSDNFTLVNNKIKNVTDSLEDMEFVTKRVFEVANRTRSDVVATAQAFQRFDIALAKTGASQEEVLRLTETLNKAMIVGGATAQEQRSGLLQLSQAFNEGALRGQEFRIISQTMPAVLEKIAESAGVTRGELKKMASQGKLTNEVLRDALADLQEDMDEKFNKLAPTIGQAWTVLVNRATAAIGKINEELGPASGISQSILWLGGAIEKLIDYVIATFKVAGEAIGAAADIITMKWGDSISQWWKEVKDGFDVVLSFTKDFANFQIALIVGSVATIIETWHLLPSAFKDMFVIAKNIFIQGIENLDNTVISGVNAIFKFIKSFANSTADLMLKVFDSVKAIWSKYDNVVKRALQVASNSAVDIVQKMINSIIETFQGLFSYLDDAAEALGGERLFDNLFGKIDLSKYKLQVAKDVGSLTSELKAIFKREEGIDFIGDVLQLDKVDLSNLKGKTSGAFTSIASIARQSFADAFETDYVGEFARNITSVIDKINAEVGNFQVRQKTEANRWAEIWGEAAKKNLSRLSKFWGNLATLQESSSKRMRRVGKAAAIVQATVDTYRAANSAMADTPGPTWVKIAAAAAAVTAGLVNVQNIASAGKFANGGIVSGTSFSGDNLTASVNSGEMILNGAQQARLFAMANTDGTSDKSNNVTIINQTRTPVEAEARTDSQGNQEIVIREAVLRTKQELTNEANVGGGQFVPALQQNFSLTRAGV